MNQVTQSTQITRVAVFDFDGTLTQRDSFLPFLQAVVGQWKFWWGLVWLSPLLLGYALGIVPNWKAKEGFLTHFLGGKSEEQLQQVAQQFAQDEIPKLLRPEAVQRLRWHQEQGHQTVLISASLETYLLPWTKNMDFDQGIGTQLEVENGLVTGRILGKNCYGSEKVKGLKRVLGDLSQYCIYSYGDSRGDRELLAVSNYPYYRKFQDD